MEKEQDRALVMVQALVKAEVPEREWNPVWGLVLVQVLVQVKDQAPEREWDPERGKDLVLERELVQVQDRALVKAQVLER